jgi:hypothetical protein
MSHAWGIIQKDKDSILMGSIWWGIGITLLIGAPILFLLNYFGEKITIWIGILFVIIVFPIVTVSLYKSGCKRLNKEK